MEPKKNPLQLLKEMKKKATEQVSYGGEFKEEAAKVHIKDCPNCGAGRAQEDGLTHCAYCKFEFMSVTLTDGINIKKENNSSK